MPTLYVFGGLPGAGKSTLARGLARHLLAPYLRIDTVEQGLRDLCGLDVQGEGYGLAYLIAADQLAVGLSVVADSVNPIELTRRAWRRVAAEAGAALVDIEVACSDADEHRRRVETRPTSVPGLRSPTWRDVVEREVDPWTSPRLVIDTAGRGPEASLDELLERIGLGPGSTT